MTPKRAQEILDSEDSVSIEDVLEAQKVLLSKDKPRKNKTKADEFRSFNKHRQNMREAADLKAELRKYWKKSS